MQKENGSYVNQLIRGIYFTPSARKGLPKLRKLQPHRQEHPRLTPTLLSCLATKKMRACCLRFLLGLNRTNCLRNNTGERI